MTDATPAIAATAVQNVPELPDSARAIATPAARAATVISATPDFGAVRAIESRLSRNSGALAPDGAKPDAADDTNSTISVIPGGVLHVAVALVAFQELAASDPVQV
jgi:hypothetical protein